MKKTTLTAALFLSFFSNSFAAADSLGSVSSKTGHIYFIYVFGSIIATVIAIAVWGRMSKKKKDSPAPMRSMPKGYKPGGYA